MDFFHSQDVARHKTRYLVFLFMCAVLCLILMANILVIALLSVTADFISISFGVVAIVCIASLYKIRSLSGGGKSVAIKLGGRLVMPNTDDPQERQLLNVVEEMALAAGMPVPSVYLLFQEPGINAFAAGYTPADAVLGISKGCINALNRDQLQGVIGHEFSHILNGDMRLNIRLIGILYGILFIGLIGRSMMYSSSYRYSSVSFGRNSYGSGPLIGLGLFIIGYTGYFFGGLIKSAVSRQREFLADASSVQFTRNPHAIADALKVIAVYEFGSEINNLHAEESSHFFFSPVMTKANRLFTTHPPLDDRIIRILPNWDGRYIFVRPKKNTIETPSIPEKKQKIATACANTIVANAVANQFKANDIDIEQGHTLWNDLPNPVKEIARDPWGARALIYGLLLNKDQPTRTLQVNLIQQNAEPGLSESLHQVLDLIETIKNKRLTAIELSLPALKTLSDSQYKNFIQLIKKLVQADNKIEPHEWCLYTLIRHYLGANFEPVKDRKPLYKTLQQVSPQLQILLTLIAGYGHKDPKETKRAFTKSINKLGLYTLTMLEHDTLSASKFNEAVQKLARCYPLLKPRILKALVTCIEHDGIITPLEMELLHAVAAIMDSPIPQLKIGQH